MSRSPLALVSCAALALACTRTASVEPSSGASTGVELAPASPGVNALRGGRLYDKFYAENPQVGFSPDHAKTPEIDGKGGPSGNGTLRDGSGNVLDNSKNHAFRAKSFFGWDLRGAAGIYGPEYQNKAYVSAHDLLSPELSHDDVARLLEKGAAGAPAYGEVLPAEDLADLVAFVTAVREHRLPQPNDIWQLDTRAPKGYVLRAGGNAGAGHAAIGGSCAKCHGADGTQVLFDDGEYSLGTLARSSAYEVWFKIVAGHPGSEMDSQLPPGAPVAAQAQWVLDVLAALCDRARYPAGAASEPDVAEGDARCGVYLR